jgi:hypothetical protein
MIASKCSGDDVCLHCRARDIQCIYLPKPDKHNEGRRKRVQTASNLQYCHILGSRRVISISADPLSNISREIVDIVDQDEARMNLSKDNRSNSMSLPERMSFLEEEIKRVSKSNPTRPLSKQK